MSNPRESKQQKHPLQEQFENFYRPEITKVVESLIKGEKEAELMIYTRLQNINKVEKQLLATWVKERYNIDHEDNPRLSPREQTLIGLMHKYGIGTTKDKPQAKVFFELAANAGDGMALIDLMFYAMPLSNEWYKLSEEAIAHGFEQQVLDVIGIFLEKTNPQKALECYQKAAPYTGPPARNLGLCYKNGELGVGKNLQKAYELFSDAVRLGNPQALCDLAYMYREGIAGLEQNKDLARQLWETAMERCPDLTSAPEHLGRLYLQMNNPSQATWNFRRAIKNGNQDPFLLPLLQTLHSDNRDNPEVCYHAAIGLRNFGSDEHKTERRTKFNDLLKNHFAVFSKLFVECDDDIDIIDALVDVNEYSLEHMRLAWYIICDITLPVLSPTILQYMYPYTNQVNPLLKHEAAAKCRLENEKQTSEADFATLFGKRHLRIIAKADARKISYTEAHKQLFGK